MISKTLLCSQSRGTSNSDGGATKTVSGFMSFQPVTETTDVGFTFVGGQTEAASTNICIPHAEFPQGISVNVVSNESTLSRRRGGCSLREASI